MTSSTHKLLQSNSASTKEHFHLLRSRLSTILSGDSLKKIPDLLAQRSQENCTCNHCIVGRDWINGETLKPKKIPKIASPGSLYLDDQITGRGRMKDDKRFSGEEEVNDDSEIPGVVVGPGGRGLQGKNFDYPLDKRNSSEQESGHFVITEERGYKRNDLDYKLGYRDSSKQDTMGVALIRRGKQTDQQSNTGESLKMETINVSLKGCVGSRQNKREIVSRRREFSAMDAGNSPLSAGEEKEHHLHTLDKRQDRGESSELHLAEVTQINSKAGEKRVSLDKRLETRDHAKFKIADAPAARTGETTNLEHVSKLKAFTDKMFPINDLGNSQSLQPVSHENTNKMADSGPRLSRQLSPKIGAENGAKNKVLDRVDHHSKDEKRLRKRRVRDTREDNNKFVGERATEAKDFVASKIGRMELGGRPRVGGTYIEHFADNNVSKLCQNAALAYSPPSIVSNNSFQPFVNPDLLSYFMTKQKDIASLPASFIKPDKDPFCTASRVFNSFAATGKIQVPLPNSALSLYGQSSLSNLAKTNYILQDFQLKYRDMLRRLTENHALLTSLYTNDVINIQGGDGKISPGGFLKNRAMYAVNGSSGEPPSWRFPSYLGFPQTPYLPMNFTPLHPPNATSHPPPMIPTAKTCFSPPLAGRVGVFAPKGESRKDQGSVKTKMKIKNQEKSTEITANSGKEKKSHRCLYCGKLYSRKYGLKIHIRTHTGYKPLKCKVCGRPFGDPSNLNKHVRLHAEGDTPYRCDFCGKVLVRRRDLERHIKSRHPTSTITTTVSNRRSHHHQHNNMTWRTVQNTNTV